MPHKLTLIGDKYKGQELPIEEGRAITIGRSSTCDICIPDRKISRIHCQIEILPDGECILTDLNSSNGTYVNNKKITESHIQEGDEILIGFTNFRFERSHEEKQIALTGAVEGAKVCAECKDIIPQDEIADGKVKQLGDQYFCPKCSAKIAQFETIIENSEAKEKRAEKETHPTAETADSPEKHSLVGQIVGKYKIIEKLDDDWLGTVYKARHIDMQRIVILRILPAELSRDRALTKGFLKEINLSGQLVHPNIVILYETGSHDGRNFIATEYVEGESLRELLNTHGSVSSERAIDIAIQIARALECAYEHKLLHKRINPGDLLMAKNGVVKLANYGVANAIEETGFGSDYAKSCTEIFRYCAPESIANPESADCRSDIYSLGATLYHALAGAPPFHAESIQELKDKICSSEPDDLAQKVSDVPESVREIVKKMMAKDPADRYSLPKELLGDLEKI